MERTVRSSRVFSGRLIGVRVDEVERPAGGLARREIVEHPGAVAVLAWDGDRVALVRQWRHAAGAALLEIPAGTAEPGEEPIRTAQRELGEEMGLAAATWEVGPSFYTAPGFCTERLTLFLATELSSVDVEAPEDEDLERAWLPLEVAVAAVEHGEIEDAKSIAGLLWLDRRTRAAARS